MRKALDKVNHDIVYCVGYGAPNVWNWAPEAGGNQWRILATSRTNGML